MRELGVVVAVVSLCACSEPVAPSAPRAERVEVQSEIVLAPSEPTPAFVPLRDGACPAGYRPVAGSCVHHTYVADDAALARALANYQRGAVPPMLGPALPKAAPRPPAPVGPLDPGALTKRVGADAGVGGAQQRRLAELDTMIAVAKEKLRERDERSKARRVQEPARANRAPSDAASAPAAGAVASAPAAPASSNPQLPDPTQARIAELSQLASQLPPEQLQALAAQLGRSGIDTRELDALLAGPAGAGAGR